MRTKFTFKTHRLFAAVALLATLLAAKASKAQAQFEAGRTYYVNGVGNDLVAPKDTFVSLAGTGTVYTGGAYSAATGIFPALSVNGIDSNTLGQITILLVPGYTGTEGNYPILKGVPFSSPNRPIIMKPFGGDYTITRSTFTGGNSVIQLEGTQFFTIDGERIPGQRNITVIPPAALAASTALNNHKVIEIVTNNNIGLAVSAVNTVTIKNINITGILSGVNSITQAGVFAGGLGNFSFSGSRRAENISVINCNIQNVQQGVYVRGLQSGASSHDVGLVVKNNIIGGDPGAYLGSVAQNQAGIAISNQANVLIEGNTISGISPNTIHFAGIFVTSINSANTSSLDSNVVINANKIYNLKSTANGSAVYGIRFYHNIGYVRSQNMSYKVTNNVISNISSFGTTGNYIGLPVTPSVPAFPSVAAFPAAISIEENSNNASIEVYNNSIAMWDEALKGTSAACVYIGYTTTGGVKLMNNIFSNRMKNFTNDENAYQLSGVLVANNTEPFDSIDNNVYDINTTGGWAFFGRTLARTYASVQEWRNYTKDDENSLTVRPVFDNLLTLSTLNGAPTTYGTQGKSLVSTDVTGAARPASNQSIGAYQFTQNPSLAPAPLQGGATYMINGVSSIPTASNLSGSFKNLTDFVNHLNSYGTTGNDTIKIVFDNGYNTSGGDSLSVIPAVIPYPGMAATRKIVLTTAPGVSVNVKLGSNLRIPGNSAVFRLLGVSDFNINGRGSNNQRTITFSLSDTAWAATSKVVSISPSYFSPASRNTVSYCNIYGNAFATSNVLAPVVYTAAGIYLGDPFPINATGLANALYGPNLNNTITNNFIGGVKTGIYWSAKDSITDQLNNINYNVVGGSMTAVAPDGRGRVYLIGGAVNQSGIYIKGLSTSVIDSNIVRNSHNSFTGFAGIFLNGSATIGRSKDLLVTRNTIYNLGCITANVGYAIGIRVGLNEANRSIRIQNNFITKIYGAGGSSFTSLSAPSGIAVFMDPTMTPGTAVINLGLNISHNTVNLPQRPLLEIGANQYTAAFFVGDRVAGLRVINNIFANTAGKSSYGAGVSTVAAIAFGGSRLVTTDAFTQNDGNVYYANGRFCANYVGLKNGVNVLANNVLQSITELKAYAGFDNLSAFGEVPFLNDTTILMNPYYIGHIVKNTSIFTEATVDKDITGAARPAGVVNTSVGALHIDPATAYEPLYGGQTYTVSGVMAPPTAGQTTGGAQFNTINNLFRYINTNGVDGNKAVFPRLTITIEITSGYAGEGDTAITPLMAYPGMSVGRNFIIRPAAGVSPVIATTGASNMSAVDGTTSVLRLQGASYVTIDGSNNGSNSRDLTIRMPLPTGGNAANIQSQQARVIDIMGWEKPAEENAIKNCNIIGNSTITGINTYAGIYQGGINNFGSPNNNVPTNSIRVGNSRNSYVNNYITAVKHGVYLRGGIPVTGTIFDSDNRIAQNIIGGNNNIGGAQPTDYFGGGAIVSPSFMYASAIAAFTQTQLTIDSNVIQNCLSAIPGTNPVLGNAGIEIGGASTTKIKISRNIISRIRATNTTSTLVSAGACGIYVNVPWTEKRSINIENNMISRIVGTINNTYGICLDGSPNTTNNIDVNIYHNSVNLSNLDTTAGIAACIGGSAFAKGDLRIENNILQNRIVRTTPNTANYIFHSLYTSGNPFLAVDNNNYFVGGPNATNNMALIGTTTVTTFANWLNYTKQDTLSLNYPAPFTNEGNLFIPAGTASPLYLGGRRITEVPVDLLGTARPAGLAASIGAHEFNGIYADSMAPKLYDYTPLPDYCIGDFTPIVIKGRVLDRNPSVTDVLYYTLNGALPELSVTPTLVDGYNRIYTIPGQPANTMIAYRISAVDGALKNGTFVNSDRTTGYNYTTTTISNFPIAIGFDAPNVYGFKTQQISGTQGWNLESFGSQSNPFLFPVTGAKAALLPASAGSASRITTPCLDFTNVKLPVIRLYVSQNSDNPTLNDSIVIKKWYAFDQYIPVIPLNPIKRVNPNPGATPRFKVYDVCLAEMNGASGFKFSVEGFSKGGSNLLIDSIIILDNFVDHNVTAVDPNSCFNDSFSVQVANTSPQNEYYLYDDISGRVVGPRGILGNGGTLTLKGYLATADSARIKAMYTNITALGCEVNAYDLTKSVSISFNTFKNGPFVKRGDAFFGMFNEGTIPNPDAVRVGGTADFEIRPPGTSTNADYGTSWTVAQVELRNYNNNQLNTTSLSIVPATPSTPALVKFTGEPADSNKLFKMSIVLRLLPRGCDSVIVRYVRVSNAPVAAFYVFNDTLCQNQGVLFNNYTSNGVFSLPVTYQWDFGDGDTSIAATPVKSFKTPGTYKVTLRTTNSSTLMDSISFSYVVNPAPTASYTYTTPCSYKPVIFTNNSTIGNGVTYAWNIAGQLRTDTNPVVVIPYSDTIVGVRLIVRNAEGCTDTVNTPTAVFAQPVAAFTANNVCAGASVQFNNASTIAPGKENRENQIGYQWAFGNQDTGYSENPLYKYPAGGTYNVTLKVISNFGCTDTVSAPVSVFDKPVTNFTFDNACKSTDVVITNSSTYSGGLDKVNYKWDFGDNSPLSYVAVPSKKYGEARSFFVTLVVTDTVHYCSDSLTKLISVKESAKAEFTAENGCVNAPIVFTNVSIVPPGVNPTYEWTFGDGGNSMDASTTHTYTTGGSKPISFTVNIDGCKSVALDTISISNAPSVSISGTTDNDSIKYIFTALPTTFSKYQWNFGDGATATGTTSGSENVYAREGTYTVILVATDANGCSAIDSIKVRVARTVGLKDDLLTAKFKFNVYPNPFSVGAKVTFEMDARNDVTLEIYDMLGRNVFTKNEGELSAGKHVIDFDESNFVAKAGAYLVKVKIGDQIITRQLIKQ